MKSNHLLAIHTNYVLKENDKKKIPMQKENNSERPKEIHGYRLKKYF